MDAVEELRQAIDAGDVDRARTLIGPVWHEREGLRRRYGATLVSAGQDSRPTGQAPGEAEREARDLRLRNLRLAATIALLNKLEKALRSRRMTVQCFPGGRECIVGGSPDSDACGDLVARIGLTDLTDSEPFDFLAGWSARGVGGREEREKTVAEIVRAVQTRFAGDQSPRGEPASIVVDWIIEHFVAPLSVAPPEQPEREET
jgi:hypothetical protein